MYVFLGDDSKQYDPDLSGMGPLVASGGFLLPAQNLRLLEDGLQEICQNYGFPDRAEFKWSPDRNMWMRGNLVEENRTRFFLDCQDLLGELGGRVILVLEDDERPPATGEDDTELDVTKLLFERIETWIQYHEEEALMVVDRPPGGRTDEDSFLEETLSLLQQGTDFVETQNIAINALSTPSQYVRSLQLADVVVSSACARIAGEDTFSPPIFQRSADLMIQRFRVNGNPRAGVGLKIHPEVRYANLYLWLLGEDRWWRDTHRYEELPTNGRLYSQDPY